MTIREDLNPFKDLEIACSTCGNLMMDMGEWPMQTPRDPTGPGFTTQCIRYCCRTCKVYPEGGTLTSGYLVGIQIYGKKVK